jgi:hypothetical protein
VGYDVHSFLEDAERLAKNGYAEDAVVAIIEKLGQLASTADFVTGTELGGLHAGAAQAEVLGRGSAGSILMLGRFPSDAPTPVHNHNSWGVVYVLEGRDRYERWRRVDDLAGLDEAKIELLDILELEPGEGIGIPPPPQDLHAQQGLGEPVWEFVFFASDPNQDRRAYFDPVSGMVAYDDAMR